MGSMEKILQALATELGCAHVVLHAPAQCADLVVPAASADDASGK